MSCGKPHETPCDEVLAEVWLFLDHECDQVRRQKLERHLEECGACLEHYGLEEHIKALLGKKCGGDHAPDALKQRLRATIRQAVLEQAEVTVEHHPDGPTVEVRARRVELTEE
ncbi:mycothiol system anti-sigma-R factor [Streptoalloteichus tenebrarius]|uniref:Mycothiol system anti-sigma-R factor n=1 Tax=Streptoalloteichus tenebrarius (strain ATCC 17920 / DSM 40477 / JCM 4838 / CBS 697.72 / NBRC 16177 / NCIMB 11028 / NRRL B-12390 / A12253. 1 / ISP 5477) TaxID=1933 RepID=A0ABT1HT51_STRSD|nr:mycothiol system anti-sigma-R factor [Streptoalloteichus tenebrarius]MCP2258705.1 mycothiol system anti-sigma-R factor [Streptoalloteichus tenebrarius]BFF02852.1 mycothiol system anti-sigma-R factor [Streptoalloteichus tenebrarius]